MSIPLCETCHRPTVACVCDRIVRHQTRLRVLVLQHPKEQDALLGSAQIVLASLAAAKLVVGLSWRNFAHALGEEGADPRRWAVLFPEREEAEGAAPRAEKVDAAGLDGIVVLDGTWSKAKTLWWRNPWLLKLRHLSLTPDKPSIYGALRKEPRRELVSTLESVGAALTLAGEDPAVQRDLERAFRTLVQRVRDAKLIPPPARKGPPGRRPRGAAKGPRAKAGTEPPPDAGG